MNCLRKSGWIVVVLWAACAWIDPAAGQETRQEAPCRTSHSLNGVWQVSIDNETTWKNIEVPGTVEDQIDVNFDGVSIYRTAIPVIECGDHERLWLQFDAVATEATVFLNDVEIGRHLGGWTPFRFDITKSVQESAGKQLLLKVVCDEKTGHNTQGFLPIFAPHFSGIWQSVRMIRLPILAIDEQRFDCRFDSGTKRFQLEIPLTEDASRTDLRMRLSIKKPGHEEWSVVGDSWHRPGLAAGSRREDLNYADWESGRLLCELPVNQERSRVSITEEDLWKPDRPALLGVRMELMGEDEEVLDMIETRMGIRSVETDGEKLLLNGTPLVVRGVLNWGYAPPGVAPSLDETFMRQEIQFVRERGFNLMKFCLWVPPTRYLELCDEMGMLAWVEYPAWHPKFDQASKQELLAEYDEFYHYDRKHPSIVLRSLTCETGPGADLDVIRSLYDLAKRRIPGAVVEDDSSWIGWNRIHDFYDDHPYGNNHTWVASLNRLKDHIAARESMPLILGEAIAADTWMDPDAVLSTGATEPFAGKTHWYPNFVESSRAWIEDWRGRHDPALNSGRLFRDSKRYAMLMRKFQIEKYRQLLPFGGYVVSVIRDVPLCSMGLIDYLGREKYSSGDWQWHRDSMVLLESEGDRRSYSSGEIAPWRFIANSTMSGEAELKVTLKPEGQNALAEVTVLGMQLEGSGQRVTTVPFKARLPVVDVPTLVRVTAELLINNKPESGNAWEFWVLPELPPGNPEGSFSVHPSLGNDLAFMSDQALFTEKGDGMTTFTKILDQPLLERARKGETIVLLANNNPGSFVTESHWFLRGGPLVHPSIADEPMGKMLVDLQHFDLAADVIPDVHSLENCDHLLALWETHDLEETRVNGLIVHIPVGAGHLIVSSVNHLGETNSAGKFLLGAMLDSQWMQAEDVDDRHFQRLDEELKRQTHPLTQTWSFTDQEIEGWNQPEFQLDNRWQELSVNRHWDSQGFGDLDGWGYYRVTVPVNKDWMHQSTWLSFTGVDDYYDLFVNGELVGTGGDREKRITAFEEKKSHDISRFIKPGQPITIAVRVFDWQGAGGIFRPVSISSQKYSETPRLLR